MGIKDALHCEFVCTLCLLLWKKPFVPHSPSLAWEILEGRRMVPKREAGSNRELACISFVCIWKIFCCLLCKGRDRLTWRFRSMGNTFGSDLHCEFCCSRVCCCGRRPLSPIRLASEKGRKNGAEARGWKCQLSWACLYLCVFGRPCPVHHVKEEARRLDLDRCRNQEDGSDFTLWVCLYSCCCGRHHPPPFASSQKKGRRKNMVSKLEVGGNSIVSWLVGRPSAVDRSRVKEETGRDGTDWRTGWRVSKQLWSKGWKWKMGVRFVLWVCTIVLLWKTPFAPLLAFVSETVQDRTVQDRTEQRC